MKRVLIFFMLFLFVKIAFAQVVYSPDKHLRLSFVLKEGGKPVYELNYKGKKVIEESKMGFILNDFLSFSENFSVIRTENTSSDTIWKPVWGENSEIRDNYNEMLLFLVHKTTNWKVNIRFRLFNDGLGFRYEFPTQKELRHFIIKEELTEFNLTGNHKTF